MKFLVILAVFAFATAQTGKGKGSHESGSWESGSEVKKRLNSKNMPKFELKSQLKPFNIFF